MYKLNKKYFNNWVYKTIDNYKKKIEVYYGGAGSGKSYGAVQKILLKAFNSKRRVLVLRKIQRTIKNSVWRLFITQLEELGQIPFCRINKSDYEIELSNGSIFLFSGLDDPEKIKSIDGITDIVCEEGTELTLDDFTQLLLRLRPKVEYPQIYIMFNPISKKNWVYDYFIINQPSNARITQTTYKDNKFLSKDYKQEIERLKDRNPAYYRIYALGEFATLDKLVFPIYEKRIISEAETKGLKRIIGLDFGYVNDPSALVWGFYDEKNRKIYIAGEYVKKGMLNDEIAEVIIDLGLSKDKIYADCAEQKSIAEIKNKGVNIEPTGKGKDSVIHGIQWIQQCELIVDERCFKVIEELENYTWKKDKKTNEYINEPVDTYNHTIDAIRYALNNYIKETKTPKVYNKPIWF